MTTYIRNNKVIDIEGIITKMFFLSHNDFDIDYYDQWRYLLCTLIYAKVLEEIT